jgi:small subunit ribosomal protein S17
MEKEPIQQTTGGKRLRGVVVSTKMKDTIVVAVTRYVQHPKYKKFMKRVKKHMAHDAGNTAQVGDTVVIREVRPLSKRKAFTLVK